MLKMLFKLRTHRYPRTTSTQELCEAVTWRRAARPTRWKRTSFPLLATYWCTQAISYCHPPVAFSIDRHQKARPSLTQQAPNTTFRRHMGWLRSCTCSLIFKKLRSMTFNLLKHSPHSIFCESRTALGRRQVFHCLLQLWTLQRKLQLPFTDTKIVWSQVDAMPLTHTSRMDTPVYSFDNSHSQLPKVRHKGCKRFTDDQARFQTTTIVFTDTCWTAEVRPSREIRRVSVSLAL